MRKHLGRLGFAALAAALWAGAAQPAAAQQPQSPLFRYYNDGSVYGPAGLPGGLPAAPPGPVDPSLTRFHYYPYYYFPHSYWPQNSPQWPEPKGHPYVRPPAYMAYPAFKEPGWRHELWTPMKYYRGHHFWLDQF